jgi:predicted naringenin-chalcone synthase
MPESVKQDYEEARMIAAISPRGACALLRLAVQKLCVDLGGSGKNLNADIGTLVRKGLDPEVQRALDSLRVVGNNAIHPGEMDLRDDVEAAFSLFEILNFIVDNQIAQAKKRAAIFERLPVKAHDAIKTRDETGQ